MPPSFASAIPQSGDSLNKGSGRKNIALDNLARVKASGGALDFMFDDKRGDGTEALYNKRSSLPSASKILAFNKARRKGWHGKKGADMRTESEVKFGKTSKASLQKLNLSRNHKVPDSLLGAMIQRTVISGVLDGPKTFKAAKISLLRFVERSLKPLSDLERFKKINLFTEKLDDLMGGNLSKKEYQKNFNAPKKIVSANPANLRLGISTVNSGLGDSLDLNVIGPSGDVPRPSTPISENMGDAMDDYLSDIDEGDTGGHFATFGKGKRGTSSFTFEK